MIDSDEIEQQQNLLTAHRATLAILLRQVATHTQAYAPPAQLSGIAEARAEIQRIKAFLRAQGETVEDAPGDEPTPAEIAQVTRHAREISQTIEGGDHNIQAVDSTVTVNQSGDAVAGDKLGGDKVSGDKITINYPAPVPAPDPLAAALAQLAALPPDHVPEPAALPPGSRMPYARNPLFVGREHDLKALATALKGGTTTAISPLAAATGLGGIGKTQLAAEFAHRYGQFFAGGVFWLSFADAATVPSEIAQCGRAGAMNLPTFDALAFDDQVASVRQAWQSVLPRLLIFDNCEDEELLAAWRPTTGGSRVLLTSRRAQWDASLAVHALPLATLPRAESIALLRTLISSSPLPGVEEGPGVRGSEGILISSSPLPGVGEGPGVRGSEGILDAIAAELGDLPLALHLAGSFLKQYRADITPAAYLAELRSAPLLDHDSLQGVDLTISPTNHDLQVGRTFALSYQRLDHVKAVDALAIQLLARAACFALGEPLPRELLLASIELPDTAARRRASRAITRLVALGLLDVEREDALRLHRLLGVFVGALAADAAALPAVEQVLLDTANRLNNAGYPAPLVAIQAHLRVVTERANARADERAAGLCNTLAYHLRMIGDLAGARPYYEQALAIRKDVLGERHPDTARSLNNLGYLLQAQGDLAGARPYYEQALAIRKDVLSERHPDTALSLNNLGYLLSAQGNLAGARPYYEQALAIRKDVLGERHPDTARSLNNLGYLLQAQGDLAGARPYYEQALAIRKEVLGEHHPNTARSLNNLGYLLQAQGDLAGARPYYEQALAIREAALGPNHPDTAQSLWWIGTLLGQEDDRDGAREQLQRAVAIFTRALGELHPTTQQCQRQLAALDAPPPSAAQQIADITARYQAAVAAARADPESDHTALAAQLEEQAQSAEQDEAEGSPYLILAAHLRALATRLMTTGSSDETEQA